MPNALPARDATEFVALAKARSEGMAFGHVGGASMPNLVARIFEGLVGATMGGDWSVRFRTPIPPPDVRRLQREIQSTLDRLERQMSTWTPASELSRFNASRSLEWVPV